MYLILFENKKNKYYTCVVNDCLLYLYKLQRSAVETNVIP